jgi:hypothetical protein
MISSHLEDADLESRVASWAASASSDDAAAVRAVIEAYGGRLAAADVAGVVSQHTGDAAVMQLSQGNKPGDDHDPRYRRTRNHVSGSCSFWNARRATGRSRSTCTSRCGSSQEGAAPASSHPDSGTFRIRLRSPSTTRRRRSRLIYLPVQGPGR